MGWPARVACTILSLVLLVGVAAADVLPAGKPAPEIAGGAWINSEPLTVQKLRGRVILIDFWTYG